MIDRPRMAVIGLGKYGRNHVLAYSDYSACDLRMVCDIDVARAEAMGKEFGVEWTCNVDEVLAAGIDAVGIATPDYAHTDVATRCLEAGKSVLVEKPLATSVAEAEGLLAAAEAAGVVAMVDFQNRWHPTFLQVRQLVEEGKIGRPSMGYVRLSNSITVAEEWLSWASRSGPEWYLLSHSLDLMCWILEDTPVSVYAVGSKGVLRGRGIDCWDELQALVRFRDSFVTFESSWIAPAGAPSVLDAQVSLYGDAGKVEFDWDYAGLSYVGERLEYPWAAGGSRDRYGRLSSHIFDSMRYFVDSVRGIVPAVAGFGDGVRNVKMIAAVIASLQSGAVVEFG